MAERFAAGVANLAEPRGHRPDLSAVVQASCALRATARPPNKAAPKRSDGGMTKEEGAKGLSLGF